MKNMFIMSLLLSSSAFAHEVPFDQPDFLKMANGDPVAAQELSLFCSATGKSLSACKAALAGNGNLKQEAARKYIEKQMKTSITYRFDNGYEIPGAKIHQISGTDWHSDYRQDADGVHRHAYSTQDRERAQAQYKKRLIDEAVAESLGSKGRSSIISNGGVSGGEFGISVPVNVIISLSEHGSAAASKNAALLDSATIAKIEASARNAYDHPELGEVIPSILCYKNEKTCYGPGDARIPNSSYEPSKDDKKEGSASGKKSDTIVDMGQEDDRGAAQ